MALQIELIPLLRRERELYAVPRGRERFAAYLEAMTMGTGEAALPLTTLNPMGREHVGELLDRMIAMDVEKVAAEAAADAAQRLRELDEKIRVAIVVADDLKGGWTNRYFADMANRFERKYEVARGWATAIFWTGEEPTLEHARAATLKSIYRTLHERAFGAATTLGAMMEQEGRAARFAGESVALPDAPLRAARAIIEGHLETKAYPVIVAVLYGDEAAASLGYPPLGLPAAAGYAVALANALADEQSLEEVLRLRSG